MSVLTVLLRMDEKVFLYSTIPFMAFWWNLSSASFDPSFFFSNEKCWIENVCRIKRRLIFKIYIRIPNNQIAVYIAGYESGFQK
jgi:hypothetical protein